MFTKNNLLRKNIKTQILRGSESPEFEFLYHRILEEELVEALHIFLNGPAIYDSVRYNFKHPFILVNEKSELETVADKSLIEVRMDKSIWFVAVVNDDEGGRVLEYKSKLDNEFYLDIEDSALKAEVEDIFY